MSESRWRRFWRALAEFALGPVIVKVYELELREREVEAMEKLAD